MTNTTSSDKIYVLDTNILIELSLWLPIDLNKVFWSKFKDALQGKTWLLLDVVMDEIKHDNDGLKKWCDEQKRNGLITPLENIHRTRAVEINEKYTMIDESTQRSTVDTYLIAFAELNKLTIFSREGSRKKLDGLYKIPDVCKELSIKMIRRPREFFEMLDYRN